MIDVPQRIIGDRRNQTFDQVIGNDRAWGEPATPVTLA